MNKVTIKYKVKNMTVKNLQREFGSKCLYQYKKICKKFKSLKMFQRVSKFKLTP